jgi:hypothetical protein
MKLLATGLAVPFLERLVRDLSLDEELPRIYAAAPGS